MSKCTRQIFVVISLVASYLLPVSVFAQDTPRDSETAVAFSFIVLVLFVILALAIIAAFGLGVVGIGNAMSKRNHQ